MKSNLLVIAGPTASGKTGLSLEVASRLNGAIISADSRMVYRGLSIGTGKPTWEHQVLTQEPWLRARTQSDVGPVYQIGGVDHYLIDIVGPGAIFTLTDWLARARLTVDAIRNQEKLPILVGGTGLYLKAFVSGYTPPPTDAGLRTEIEQLSSEEILAELMAIDSETAQREAKNHRRLVRALEVARLTGRAISSHSLANELNATVIAPNWPRHELYARIDKRIHSRLASGMIDEVRQLLASGVSPEWLVQIGLEYRIISQWLITGTGDKAGLVSQLSGAIHAYARRQLTYLRTQLKPTWVTPSLGAQQVVDLLK